MKITKEKLRQMILEEMSASKDEAMDFEKEKLTGVAAKKQTRAGAEDLLSDLTPHLAKEADSSRKSGQHCYWPVFKIDEIISKRIR